MKANTMFCALGLTVMALFFCTSATAATSDNLFDMMEQLDKSDKQDFQSVIDKANACTRARNFQCSATELARAAKTANSGQDKKILLASQNSLANEQQQVANEIRRAEEARQAQIQREEQQRQAQARAEEAAEDRRQTAANISGLVSILGATASNYAALRAQQQAAGNVGNNILADSQRAADAMRADTERRARESRQQPAGQQASQRPTPNLATTTAYGSGASAGSGAAAGVSVGVATASKSGGSGQFFVYSRDSREEACELSMRRTKEDGQDITGTCSCNTLFGKNNCRAEVRSATSGTTVSSALSPAVMAAAQACPNDYRGPDDDPQFDSFCKLAQMNQCLDRVTRATTYAAQTQAACNTLDQLLRKTKGGRAANYCSYCK